MIRCFGARAPCGEWLQRHIENPLANRNPRRRVSRTRDTVHVDVDTEGMGTHLLPFTSVKEAVAA